MTIQQLLAQNHFFIATAESLTAGLLSSELARVAGASSYFLGGVVSYQDEIKHHLLGVDPDLIANNTAVDSEIAIQMAVGVRERFAKDCSKSFERVIGISTTGVAGPDPVGNRPVGQVFIGLATPRSQFAVPLQLHGTRDEIRGAVVKEALSVLEDEIHLLLG